MDIYVVLCDGKVIGASARLQGAELIRSQCPENPDRTEIVNVELQDCDDDA